MMVRRNQCVSVLALGLFACGDVGSSSDASTTDDALTTTAGTSSDPTMAPTSAPVTTASTSLEPSTAGPTEPDPTTGTTTTTTSTGTTNPTGGDTSSQDPQCPLLGTNDGELRTFTPDLFLDGGDPSGTDACAMVNPERGFHGYVNLLTLDAGALEDAAADGLSLVYGQVLLPEYRDIPLDSPVLQKISDGFDLAREHGFKVVPRFHYSNAADEPDAELDRIRGHIQQLTPIFFEHADVILTLQAGFIGAWGEWHSSQFNLDAPGPRKKILDALLAALPATRTVTVRRPLFKHDAYGGPLTAENAFDGSALARVGHVNDCFLASDDDEGTYQLPGEKDYAVADSLFVPVGGETCAVNPPRSECASAISEMLLHHWTHLNLAYHPDVIAGWKDEGCFEHIACRLGYRMAVRELRWLAKTTPGGAVPISLQVVNDGFAAPVNARPMIFVLDGPARVEVTAEATDLRRWLPGEDHTVCVDVALPADAAAGAYRIGVRFPDAAKTLAKDPRQALRLVGGTWDAAEGINWFDAMVTVE